MLRNIHDTLHMLPVTLNAYGKPKNGRNLPTAHNPDAKYFLLDSLGSLRLTRPRANLPKREFDEINFRAKHIKPLLAKHHDSLLRGKK